MKFGFGEIRIRIMLPVTYNQIVAFLYNNDIDTGTQTDSAWELTKISHMAGSTHMCIHTYTMESLHETLNLVLGVSFILNKWSK